MGAQAKVKLPNVVGDNMVLQQNTDARLWGWAAPGKKVKVTTSWRGRKGWQVAGFRKDTKSEL